MCIEQCQSAPHRRRFLALSAANIAVASFCSRRAICAVPATNITADEAIARLTSGNEKFVTAPQLCALELLKQRGEFAKAQTPWAVARRAWVDRRAAGGDLVSQRGEKPNAQSQGSSDRNEGEDAR